MLTLLWRHRASDLFGSCCISSNKRVGILLTKGRQCAIAVVVVFVTVVFVLLWCIVVVVEIEANAFDFLHFLASCCLITLDLRICIARPLQRLLESRRVHHCCHLLLLSRRCYYCRLKNVF